MWCLEPSVDLGRILYSRGRKTRTSTLDLLVINPVSLRKCFILSYLQTGLTGAALPLRALGRRRRNKQCEVLRKVKKNVAPGYYCG